VADKYWVQVAYHRKQIVPAPIPHTAEWPAPTAEAEAISAELSGQAPPPDDLVPVRAGGLGPGEKIRVLTKEQEDFELAAMRATDNPRVRRIFDILDAPSKRQAIPEGIRLNQGDLVAPGLILDERPFPEWFYELLTSNGWEFNKGAASFMLLVDGKPSAEAWYTWVFEILRRESEYAKSTGTTPLMETVGVYIREDHTDLFAAEVSNFG